MRKKITSLLIIYSHHSILVIAFLGPQARLSINFYFSARGQVSVIYVKIIILLCPRQAPSQAAAGSADCRQTGRKSKTDKQMISLVVWDSQEIKLSSRTRSRSAGAGATVGAHTHTHTQTDRQTDRQIEQVRLRAACSSQQSAVSLSLSR
jgi:hypothetical protein